MFPNCPRFTRSGPVDFNFTQPASWSSADRPIGGGEKSAAGIPSNYVLRVEPLLRVRVRLLETEWAAYVAFHRIVDAAGEAITVRPDQNISSTITAYIESPSVANGESLEQQRDDADGEMCYVDLVLRRSSETVLDVPLYG